MESLSFDSNISNSYGGYTGLFRYQLTLVTLVNDSEYSKSTGAKPILSRSCIYLVSPGALCCCVLSLLLLKKSIDKWRTLIRSPKGRGSGNPTNLLPFCLLVLVLPPRRHRPRCCCCRLLLRALLRVEKPPFDGGEKKTSSDVDTMICVCTRKASVATQDSCAGTQPQNLVGKGRH